MQQLGFCKKEILKKLEAYGIKDLRFRIGRVSQKNSPESPNSAPVELSREEALFISELLSGVNDDMLRESIKKSIEKSLLTARPRR